MYLKFLQELKKIYCNITHSAIKNKTPMLFQTKLTRQLNESYEHLHLYEYKHFDPEHNYQPTEVNFFFSLTPIVLSSVLTLISI